MDGTQSLGSRAGLAIASLLLCAGLVLGFKAPDDGTVAVADGTTSTGTSGSSGTGTGTTTPSARPGSGTGSGGGTSANGTETVTGSLISTRYGPVQVQVTITNRKITAISAVALPSGGRSGMISSYAAPILTSEALSAQSANIDLVSGATYTSTGYEKSLQAALDKAGI